MHKSAFDSLENLVRTLLIPDEHGVYRAEHDSPWSEAILELVRVGRMELWSKSGHPETGFNVTARFRK